VNYVTSVLNDKTHQTNTNYATFVLNDKRMTFGLNDNNLFCD